MHKIREKESIKIYCNSLDMLMNNIINYTIISLKTHYRFSILIIYNITILYKKIYGHNLYRI